MKRFPAILIVCVCGLYAATLNAQQRDTRHDVPATISYQGVLTTAGGITPADGSYEVTMSLYADETGSDLVWRDRYTVEVAGGVFGVMLGGGTFPLPKPAQMNRALWIGVAVDGAQEMRPLAALASTPYALNVADGAITTAKLADGAVTPEKLAGPQVSSVSVGDMKLSGDVVLKGGDGLRLDYDKASNSVLFGLANDVAASDDETSSGEASGEKEKGRGVLNDPNDWTRTGNAIVATDFLGSTNNVTTEIRTNNTTAMRYQPSGTNTPNIIGGSSLNVTGGGVGNVIAGGGTSGSVNTIDDGDYNAIGGGVSHYIHGATSSYNTIGGGHANEIASLDGDASFATVGGGESNNITDGMNHATIGGGLGNIIHLAGIEATIGGGHGNVVQATSATVGGGTANIVSSDSHYGTIAGGHANLIGRWVDGGTIGGGYDNEIAITATVQGDATAYPTISGGSGNVIDARASHATIGGGQAHGITSAGLSATIPGGDWLQAQSWAQTVVGAFNEAKGNVPPRYNGAGPNAYNYDPLFIVGNGYIDGGGNTQRSNAFEVSYTGHSVVYHNNGGGTPVIRGATYTDNVIYAWGAISSVGTELCNGFGISSTTQMGPGWYRIELNPVDPDGNPMSFTCASVTATLSSSTGPINNFRGECKFITASRVGGLPGGGLGFDVYISKQVIHCDPVNPAACPTLECEAVDNAFFFKVTGRPNQ